MAHNSSRGKSGRAWKMERASVNARGRKRSKSNKYLKESDQDKRPASGERERVWVGGYTRSDGTEVEGYYRATPR